VVDDVPDDVTGDCGGLAGVRLQAANKWLPSKHSIDSQADRLSSLFELVLWRFNDRALLFVA
jgi:hypothetical protein